MTENTPFDALPRIFTEFAEILVDDEVFPDTHAHWDRLTEGSHRRAADAGYIAKFLEVRPAVFRRFLKEMGGSPSMDGLPACVALLAHYRQR